MDQSQNTHKVLTGRTQIGPRITPATKELLDRRCEEGSVSVSDVVEMALRRCLSEEKGSIDLTDMWDKVEALEETFLKRIAAQQNEITALQQEMHRMLTQLLTGLQALAPTKEPVCSAARDAPHCHPCRTVPRHAWATAS